MRGTRVRATATSGQQKFRLIEGIRFAGIGDALGVDWQGLIAETRQQATDHAALQGRERDTSAKQRWQPHRVLLDMGISFGMAGTEYAQRVLAEARQQLLLEQQKEQRLLLLQEQQKEEQQKEQLQLQQPEVQAEQQQGQMKNESERQDSKQSLIKPFPAHDYRELFDSEHLEPLACVQLGLRTRATDRQRMVGNVCGPGSRALSARQDLRLRRQLCGLPARECDFPRNVPIVSEGLRSLAMHMFQRTLDVK